MFTQPYALCIYSNTNLSYSRYYGPWVILCVVMATILTGVSCIIHHRVSCSFIMLQDIFMWHDSLCPQQKYLIFYKISWGNQVEKRQSIVDLAWMLKRYRPECYYEQWHICTCYESFLHSWCDRTFGRKRSSHSCHILGSTWPPLSSLSLTGIIIIMQSH